MKMRPLVAAITLGFLFLFAPGLCADAATIRVLSAIALQPVMEDLGPSFERATGHKLVITFDTLGGVLKRVQEGDPAEIVIIPRQGIDELVKSGKAAPETATVVARSGMAVAVRRGVQKPDVSSPEALKNTLLAARTITYSDPAHGGPGGIHFAKVLDRLGIAGEMRPKTVFLPRPGPVGTLVANGQAEIAVGQRQELVQVPGIEIAGPLPGDLQNTLVFSAAVMAAARNAEAPKALLDFLRTPAAARVIEAKGMERGASVAE